MRKAPFVERSIVGAPNRYKAHLTLRAGADEIARRFPAHWGTVTPSRPTPASTAPATTISAGWRCESPCSASTSRCTSHRAGRASTSAPRPARAGRRWPEEARRWARQGQLTSGCASAEEPDHFGGCVRRRAATWSARCNAVRRASPRTCKGPVNVSRDPVNIAGTPAGHPPAGRRR